MSYYNRDLILNAAAGNQLSGGNVNPIYSHVVDTTPDEMVVYTPMMPGYDPTVWKPDYNTYHQTSTRIQVTQDAIRQVARPWMWTSFCISAIGMFLPGIVCSFIGLLYSLTAYTDHKSGHFHNAINKKCCARSWAYTGLIIGLISLIAILSIMVYDGGL